MTPAQITEANTLLNRRKYLLESLRLSSAYGNKPSIVVRVKLDGHDHPSSYDMPADREEVLEFIRTKLFGTEMELHRLGVDLEQEGDNE